MFARTLTTFGAALGTLCLGVSSPAMAAQPFTLTEVRLPSEHAGCSVMDAREGHILQVCQDATKNVTHAFVHHPEGTVTQLTAPTDCPAGEFRTWQPHHINSHGHVAGQLRCHTDANPGAPLDSYPVVWDAAGEPTRLAHASLNNFPRGIVIDFNAGGDVLIFHCGAATVSCVWKKETSALVILPALTEGFRAGPTKLADNGVAVGHERRPEAAAPSYSLESQPLLWAADGTPQRPHLGDNGHTFGAIMGISPDGTQLVGAVGPTPLSNSQYAVRFSLTEAPTSLGLQNRLAQPTYMRVNDAGTVFASCFATRYDPAEHAMVTGTTVTPLNETTVDGGEFTYDLPELFVFDITSTGDLFGVVEHYNTDHVLGEVYVRITHTA